MNTVVIREYYKIDFTKLCSLLKLNIPTFFSEVEYQDFEKYLKEEIENYFVAEINNVIVGFRGINYKKKDCTAMISWDIIHPDYQRNGIGSKILIHRLNFIKQHYPSYNIIVRTSQLVYKFYEKHGFKLLEQHKDFWAIGFDMYKMEYTGI